MKIVNLIGGLGNQMFQYAFAIALEQRFPNEKVVVDISHFKHLFLKEWKGYNLHNGYEIEKVFPNAYLKHATAWQLMRLSWYVPNYIMSRVLRKVLPKRKREFIQHRKDIFVYQPDVFNITGNCYYEGNWESARYFDACREKIQQVYSHGIPNDINLNYIKCMEAENSVGVHVRRGDYMKSTKWSGICTYDYYKRAFDIILSDAKPHTFYIFSNDMAWCKENLPGLADGHKMVFVNNNSGKDSCWDMFLMSHCKDLVIANSSFSWWGAFLNKRNGKVVAPDKWMNEEREIDIWLEDWIRI